MQGCKLQARILAARLLAAKLQAANTLQARLLAARLLVARLQAASTNIRTCAKNDLVWGRHADFRYLLYEESVAGSPFILTISYSLRVGVYS